MDWQPFDCSAFNFLENCLTERERCNLTFTHQQHRKDKQNPFQFLSSEASAVNAKFVQHPYGITTVGH